MSHLKRLNMPKTWPIKRKGIKFVMKSKPGPHPLDSSIPLGVVIRDVLKYANNKRDVKYILNNKIIIVDGIRRKDYRLPVGLFDVIRIPDTEETFRVVYSKKGKIELIPEKLTDIKICKITGKTKVKGKTQLNLNDGKNILIDKDEYKVGDSLVISLPKSDVKEHIKFEKNVLAYLIGGKHIGGIGKIESISADKIVYKNEKGSLIETLKEYAFPIGKDKALITIKK